MLTRGRASLPMIRKRKGKEEPADRSLEWMTTYSDMVTLLLAFFVLLFSFSAIDVDEFERVMMSLQQALGMMRGGRTIVSEDPMMDLGHIRDREREQIEAIQRRQLLEARMIIEQRLSEVDRREDVTFDMTERGLVMHFTDRVLFDSGEAELLPEAREILDALAPTLADLPNEIRIEGHTDHVPINTFRFPSNWELSTARSTSVLRHLLGTDVFKPYQMSAAGYGEYRPRDTNETEAGRARNRRVDVILLRLDMHANQGQAEYVPFEPDEDADSGGVNGGGDS